MPGLSPRLKTLVGEVEALLGETIAAAEGRELYDAVERVRRHMVRAREGSPRTQAKALAAARAELRSLTPAQRASLARAYTIYLELVNICENAYRTHRLRERARRDEAPAAAEQARGARVVWVLTAHPTESRSVTNIKLMRRGQLRRPDPQKRVGRRRLPGQPTRLGARRRTRARTTSAR